MDRPKRIMRLLEDLYHKGFAKCSTWGKVEQAAKQLLGLPALKNLVAKSTCNHLAIVVLTRVLQDLGAAAVQVEDVEEKFSAIKGYQWNWHCKRPQSCSSARNQSTTVLRATYNRLTKLTASHHHQPQPHHHSQPSGDLVRHNPEDMRHLIGEICQRAGVGPRTTDYALTVGNFACNHPSLCNFKLSNLASGVVTFAQKQAELANVRETQVHVKQIVPAGSSTSVYQVIAALNSMMTMAGPAN